MMTDQVISGSDIYWLTRLDAFGDVLGALTIVASIAVVSTVICSYIAASFAQIDLDFEHSRKMGEKKMAEIRKARGLGFKLLPVPIALAILGALLPSTKEACAIMVIPKIANIEDVQGFGADLVGLAREWVAELKPKPSQETPR